MGLGARGNPIQGLYPQPPQLGGQSALMGNPLQMIPLAIQMQQNQRAQQQFNAQRAVGQAVQGGIDANGNYDPNKTLTGIANNPAAALAAGEGTSTALAARNANLETAQRAVNLNLTQTNAGQAFVASLSGMKEPDGSPLKFSTFQNKFLAYAKTIGMDPATQQRFLAGVSQTPQGVQDVINNARLQTAGPASGMEPRQMVVPEGQTGPNGEPPGSTIQGQASGVIRGAPSYQTQLAPGSATAIAAPKEASAQMFAKDATSSANYRNDVYPLEQIVQDLPKIANTGPGSANLQKFKSFIATMTPEVVQPILQSMGLTNVDEISSMDQVQKYMTQAARRFGNTSTNDQLAAAFSGSPNVNQQKAAIDTLTKSMLSLRRMDEAKFQTYLRQLPQGQAPDPQDYAIWAATKWNHVSDDPRAFGVDMMNHDQLTKLQAQLKKEGPAAERRFNAALTAAGGGEGGQGNVLEMQPPEEPAPAGQ